MSYPKIEQTDLTDKGVVGLPDTPNLSTMEMQRKFDEIALDVIVPKFNELSDDLDEAGIEDKISSEDITDLRYDEDYAIEISNDNGEHWHKTSSSGHKIKDSVDNTFAQRKSLKFNGSPVSVVDDEANNQTIVTVSAVPGPQGDAATIRIGEVESGESASVTNVGSLTDAIFDFTLPKGDDGNAATVSVGTVASGTTASVTNRGTSSAAVLDFVLPKGDQGDPGTGLTLLGTYATVAALEAAHPTGHRGDAYFIEDDEHVYLWDVDSSSWEDIGAVKGPKGDTGNTPAFSIGTVTSGSTASVTVGGTTDNPTLSFVLQPGDKGDTGNAATIAVGTVTSGATASVTNSGTSSNATFDFVLPKGDKGDPGSPTTVNGKSGSTIKIVGTDIELTDNDSTKVDAAISAVDGHVGTLSNLTTTAKTSAVAAINEINTAVGRILFTSAVTALTGATSVTIQDAGIHTTSIIFPCADNGTNTMMAPPTVTVTEGQAVLGFDALEQDTSFTLVVINP